MIFLDHAATTPLRPEARAAMEPFLGPVYGNPSSIHAAGQEARRAVDAARDTVARVLGARGEEILFTASGTEANNLAITGAFLAAPPGRRHLVTAATEHHSVLHTCRFLEESLGAEVTVLPLDRSGRVDPEEVRQAIRRETCLVSIMAANNEIGTLAPLAEIAAVARAAGVPFHTDAVQLVGSLPVDVEALGVDLLSLSGHKFYGPKGAGALYVRRGTRIQPLLYGGGQERGYRAGTENVAGIVGMARALELARAEMGAEAPRQSGLRDRLFDRLRASVADVELNGHPTQRLPNNLNVAFRGIDSEVMLLNLDLEGIAASAGSACTAGSIEPSHVIAALGWPPEPVEHPHSMQRRHRTGGPPIQRVRTSIRFSLGRGTTEAEIDHTAATVAAIVHRLNHVKDLTAETHG